VGTIIRSALAFGFDTVIVEGVDIYNDKVIRSTQGAIFQINIIQTQNAIEELLDHQIIATVLNDNAINYQNVKLENKFAIMMGNEGEGLDDEAISFSNIQAYIPIKFESLNVASAAAIFMNEYSD
jgi:TrmH family RNA methyltransferase